MVIDIKALAQRIRSIFGAGAVTGFEAFEFDTVGGSDGVLPKTPPPPPPRVDFLGGWWAGARRFDIHKGRLGGNTSPWATVVHTTDMVRGTMQPLLKRWRDAAGEGAGATFLIGREPEGVDEPIPRGGIVQLAPITRNSNHAGGPTHGWFKLASGRLVHPNSVAVGIEVDNAGRLYNRGGGERGAAVWVHKDSGKVFPAGEVYIDTHGRGYEKLTAYQWTALETLLDVLDRTMLWPPEGVTVVPNGSYRDNGVPEASLPWCREVGHWTLDPTRKTDPGPEVDAFLEKRAAARSHR